MSESISDHLPQKDGNLLQIKNWCIFGHDRFPSADFFETLLKFAMFELKIFPFRHDSDFQNHLKQYKTI
jgi:hypothetical protein